MDESRSEIRRLRSLLFTEDPVSAHVLNISDDVNISTLCRTCLSESASNDLTNEALCIISRSGKLVRVYEMYESVTGLKIEPNDGLPRFLCSACLKLINSLYTFQTQSARAQEIFESVMNAMKNEQECFTIVHVQDDVFLPEDEDADDLHAVDSNKYSEEIAAVTPKEEESIDEEDDQIYDDLMEIEKLDEVSEQGELSEGLNTEAAIGELNCPFCPKVFYLQRDIIQHYKDEHPKEKPYKCAECQVSFAHIQSMRRHKKLTHMHGSKEKMCPQCSRLFHRADDLKRHIRTHTDERPYACSVCEKAFKQHTELKDHMLRHMDTKMYKCSLCSKELRSRNGWYLHMKLHQEGAASRRRARKKKFVDGEEEASLGLTNLLKAT